MTRTTKLWCAGLAGAGLMVAASGALRSDARADEAALEPAADAEPDPAMRDPFAPDDLGPDAIPEAAMTPEQRRDALATEEGAQRLRSEAIHKGFAAATNDAVAAAQRSAAASILELGDLAQIGVTP